jgi:hypothetical protein
MATGAAARLLDDARRLIGATCGRTGGMQRSRRAGRLDYSPNKTTANNPTTLEPRSVLPHATYIMAGTPEHATSPPDPGAYLLRENGPGYGTKGPPASRKWLVDAHIVARRNDSSSVMRIPE